MNYRPWRQRLAKNPFSFAWELVSYHFERRGFTNPTLQLARTNSLDEMLFDTASGALNGVALGSEISAIKDFGPADGASSRGDMVWLEYASRGLSMTYVNGKLVTIDLFFDSLFIGMHPTKFVPCRELTVRRSDGAIFRLNGDSPPAALEKMFGPPFDTEDDDYTFGTEKVYSHGVGDRSIGAAFDAASNRLIHLEICPISIGIPNDGVEQ